MEHNRICQQYGIVVIRAVMQDKTVPPFPEGLALEELYAFAKLHNVEALLYYGLCQLDLDFEDPIWQNWENRVAMLLAQGIVQLSDRDELFAVLTNAGIPLLPFKGCWLKEQYPNMEYRQMADLDMLIPADRAQEAKKILLSMGYQTESFEDSPNHTGYLKPPYTEVELHVRLLQEDGGYYDDIWDRAQEDADYPCLYRFSPEDEYIYYFLHINKHLEDAGTGIRSILDCIVYRDVYPDMDRGYLKQELDKWNLWELAKQIETLSDCWFRTGEAIPEALEDLALSILAAGSYGTMETRSRQRLERLQETYKNPLVRSLVYWVIQVCRPMNEMERSYPILKRIPVLLPVFWIYRAVMKFTKHPKKIWHHITLVFGKRNEHG